MHRQPMPVRFQVTSKTYQEIDHEDYELRLVRALIDNGATVLEKLLKVQDEGWNDEGADVHFQKQRATADNSTPELEDIWFNKMKSLLQEIDTHLRCIPAEGAMKFLDLGCCPGGFSSYILSKNTEASGIGVSLPVEDGGHAFKLESYFRTRHKLYFGNLIKYQLESYNIEDSSLQPLPSEIHERTFDIVLLDGHQLRTQLSAKPGDMHRLVISQLIIALQSVKPGGTVIVKLSIPHKPTPARILHMFRMISARVSRWKPEVLHANRGTFYAVAEGVGGESTAVLMSKYLKGLKSLWFELTYGGEEGEGRLMSTKDLDFIATVDDIIEHHLDWLATLGNPLWHVQANALERLYKKKHIRGYKRNTKSN